ncbi:MAG TPA: heavy metal-associated domain-containing protein [Sulfuricurvum sp.]|nr:MAG: hypothetical protein B7Y30_02675 [Campylobacterales bacterium 16-40-21]OZA04132.1 MAG: hypothetical protein B7X89_00840 [Sulfuricurvum sp. 17-40-25]HQS66139.1 heavy metal-associated domain-containing protein [Sulfuricurvum sp.]HQT35503.1 heavy metal-associated domain-containing protein [Sulfuricurvum sp.]
MIKIAFIFLIVGYVAFAQSLVKFKIGGMSCNSCANGINSNLSKDFPKYTMDVDFDSATLTAQSKDGTNIDVKKVQKAFQTMGYKATLIK